jgi:hypothetical protein
MTMTASVKPAATGVDDLYRAGFKPQVVHVPRLTFLQIDGHGDPNTSPRYAEVVQALYTVSYTVKFAIERSGGPDHKVSALEGLWWSADLSTFSIAAKADWDWTMMIRQPDDVDPELVAHVSAETAARKRMPLAAQLRLAEFTEGWAAQVIHLGPYATEEPTITGLHEFIHDLGHTFDGHVHKHHEIYLSDPRRTAPERIKTIIRQPFTAGARPTEPFGND